MTRPVVFLHTLRGVVEQFDALAREMLPEVQAWHIVDEMLARIVVAEGYIPPFVYRRITEHARAAEEAGAVALQITCSSISPAGVSVRPFVAIPILTVDEPMVDRALGLGPRVGIAATAPTALTLIARLIEERGEASRKPVVVTQVLCEGAYPLLLAGDLEGHDRIVRQYLAELAPRSDVVLVAQASMARAAAVAGRGLPVPVLSSPRPAIERLRDCLAELG